MKISIVHKNQIESILTQGKQVIDSQTESSESYIYQAKDIEM